MPEKTLAEMVEEASRRPVSGRTSLKPKSSNVRRGQLVAAQDDEGVHEDRFAKLFPAVFPRNKPSD